MLCQRIIYWSPLQAKIEEERYEFLTNGALHQQGYKKNVVCWSEFNLAAPLHLYTLDWKTFNELDLGTKVTLWWHQNNNWSLYEAAFNTYPIHYLFRAWYWWFLWQLSKLHELWSLLVCRIHYTIQINPGLILIFSDFGNLLF